MEKHCLMLQEFLNSLPPVRCDSRFYFCNFYGFDFMDLEILKTCDSEMSICLRSLREAVQRRKIASALREYSGGGE